MLDNEPDNGAEGTTGTTETADNGAAEPTLGEGEVRVSASEPAKGARRAAGPPPEPEDSAPFTPATSLAGSGEGGTVNTSVSTASPHRRTVRAAGRPEEPVAEPAPASDSGDGATATTGTDRSRTRDRSRNRSARAPVTEEAEETEEAEAAESTAVTEVTEPEEGIASDGSAVFRSPSMLFQPPVAQQQDPAPAAASARDREDADRGRSKGGKKAQAQTTRASGETEGAEERTAQATGTEETGEAGAEERSSRRRRRRGGRGRGRSRGIEENGGEDADETAKESRSGGVDSGESAGGGDQTEEDQGSGSRRRRRRRRTGSGDDATSDDPPNTVVKVREPRSDKQIEDEVQAVRGSTRLEAKKQRRREGREQGRRRAPIVTESEFLARRESVKRDLVVRRQGDRTQIAVLEDDILVEHYVDRAAHRSYVGNVYLGRVQNVLPSMEAAFVDIGKGRNAVLYAGEVNWDSLGLDGQPKRIESVLKSGQSVLVQVTKDPVGHKGARLTSQISMPGRYLVYVPGGSMTGISRKLPDKERARLKQILKKVMPSGAGVIVRTAAEGASEEELERDITRLAKQWDSIKRKSKSASAPALLNSEPDLTIRVVRDVFNEDFSSLVVSGEEAWSTVHEYVEYVAPNLAERLSHWTEDRDVFSAYRIDEQINKGLERKVWLPSGGSLIIDRTEAMTVVDVNTGKFTGQGGNLEETVTKNNLEAAEEIVRQLRLRDIGGIIVIDFIDMVLESNRDLVLRRMLECLARDRTKHQVAEVTSLGLVQMTRKRVGQGLLEAFSHSCEHCNGRGLVISNEPVDHKSGGNGNGRKKKKGKADADQPAEKAEKTDKPEKAGKAGKAEKPRKAGKAEPAQAESVEEPDRAEKPEKPAKARKTRKSAQDAAEGVDASVTPDTGSESTGGSATEPAAESEQAEPVKRTRKRTSTANRSRKAAEAADTAGTTSGEESGEPAAETGSTTAQNGAEPAQDAASDEADDPSAEERPKRRRTRRRTTVSSSAETS